MKGKQLDRSSPKVAAFATVPEVRFTCFRCSLLFMCAYATCGFGQETPPVHLFNVRAFGAVGDGRALDTGAIGKAVIAANAAGGGTVVFPAGTYLSGTFDLLSNVTLDFQPGSILEGSPNVADYKNIGDYGLGRNYGVDSSGEGTKVGIIVARNAENIAIIGHGALDGDGDSFFNLDQPHSSPDFDAKYTRQGTGYDRPQPGLYFGPSTVKPAGRPGTMLIFFHCKNVLLRDITLSNAPNWTLHLQSSEDALITGVRILNNLLLPNNDGIDCMASKRVRISDCDIRTGDDDFAIVGSDDIEAANCSLTSRSAAIRLEDTRFSTFSNLSIHSNRGIGIFGRGDEHTAHVLFSDITMETTLIGGHWWGKAEPIYIAARGGKGNGEIRDVRFSNILAEAESGIVLDGNPDSLLRDIEIDGLKLHIRAPRKEVADTVGGNFDLRWTATNLSEAIFKHDIPALYTRHVNGLTLRNFDVTWAGRVPDYFSTAIECEDFDGLSIAGFDGGPAPSGQMRAAVELRNGANVLIRDSHAAENTRKFLVVSHVTGERRLVGNDLSNAAGGRKF